MRPKFVTAVFAVAALILIVAFWLRPNRQTAISPPTQEAAGSNTAPVAVSSQKADSSSMMGPPAGSLAQSAGAPSQADPQKRQEMFQQAVAGKNSPIEFYGRFIDQDSNALPGVDIKAVIRQWVVPDAAVLNAEGKQIRVEKLSDSDGRFEISGETGDAFDIESIQRNGYEPEPGSRTFGAVGGSSENPVMFKMWSTNIHEQLITGQMKSQIEPDGRPYVIDLIKGTIAESGSGDLKVWVKYPPQVTAGQLYNWSCEIDALNDGGILEQPLGTAMYSAPADGYLPSFQLQQQIKGGQYGSTGERHFYVMLNNGQEFGQIAITLYAPYTDQVPGLVRLQYAINPSGSHILR